MHAAAQKNVRSNHCLSSLLTSKEPWLFQFLSSLGIHFEVRNSVLCRNRCYVYYCAKFCRNLFTSVQKRAVYIWHVRGQLHVPINRRIRISHTNVKKSLPMGCNIPWVPRVQCPQPLQQVVLAAIPAHPSRMPL